MTRKFFSVLAAVAIIFFGSRIGFAENLRFIDAVDYTGYYVDMDTVKIQSDGVFTVNMVVIRADLNQMEIADLRINHRQKKYVIRSSRTLSYDERTELTTDDRERPARSYSDKSLMGEVVRIILYGGD